jgi:hypothetical protein
MKENRTANQLPEPEQNMLPEYRFDYSKARPNRFAAGSTGGFPLAKRRPTVEPRDTVRRPCPNSGDQGPRAKS